MIKRALISVSDKTGIEEAGRRLKALGFEILSTGGTAKTLTEAGVKVREVCKQIQNQVSRSISEMVGMEVGRVNVHVEDIDFSE